MAFKIVVKPIVFMDIDEAVNYYAQESGLLAERFYNSVISKFEHIQQNPASFGFVHATVRSARVPHFPFRIFFLVSCEQIVILGIAHFKRSNRFVRKRLS
jgi:ParE toxin of type II toxin-antitoxin system, parDE